MKILFLGDIFGRAGREGVQQQLPELKKRLKPDVVIANAENAAAGSGLTMKVAGELFAAGIDCLTLGNHAWDQREMITAIGNEPRIVRPLNYPDGTPGKGFYHLRLPDGRALLIVSLMGRLFVDPVIDDPFPALEKVLAAHKLSGRLPIFVDFHAEATSEKMAVANVFDGRVSAVIGSHTHVPTADEVVLPKGTAYMSDAGMCGDYDSIVGMKKDVAIWRFTRKTPPMERKSPAEGPATVCGAFIKTSDDTGLALTIDGVRIGGILKPSDARVG